MVLTEELRRAGAGHAASIRTFTNPRELRQLYELAHALPPGAQVVEIGSYLGASSCYLAAGLRAKGGKLLCIDTWQNETMPDGDRDTYADFRQNVAPFGSLVTMLRKRSDHVESVELPVTCDLAFIDGDHAYEMVSRDIGLVVPRISENGIVVFHDAIHFPGVSRAIGDLLVCGGFSIEGRIDNLVWLRRRSSPS